MLVFVDIEKVLFFIQNIKFYLAKKLVVMPYDILTPGFHTVLSVAPKMCHTTATSIWKHLCNNQRQQVQKKQHSHMDRDKFFNTWKLRDATRATNMNKMTPGFTDALDKS